MPAWSHIDYDSMTWRETTLKPSSFFFFEYPNVEAPSLFSLVWPLADLLTSWIFPVSDCMLQVRTGKDGGASALAKLRSFSGCVTWTSLFYWVIHKEGSKGLCWGSKLVNHSSILDCFLWGFGWVRVVGCWWRDTVQDHDHDRQVRRLKRVWLQESARSWRPLPVSSW